MSHEGMAPARQFPEPLRYARRPRRESYSLDQVADRAEGEALTAWVDRVRAATSLDSRRQKQWAQYFTPFEVARVMADMIPAANRTSWRVLDPGAGVGVLAAAAIERLSLLEAPPAEVHVTAYEIDGELVPTLDRVLGEARAWASHHGVSVTVEVRQTDFLADACETVAPTLGAANSPRLTSFDLAILNPPYGKLGSASHERACARLLGADAPNLYAAFVVAAMRLTRDRGNVIAITPRSFCNGTYFRAFRRFLLATGGIRRMHVFDTRNRAFAKDGILQENLITHVEIGARRAPISLSAQPEPGGPMRLRSVPSERVVYPADPNQFIHVVPDAASDEAAVFVAGMPASLGELGLAASTGRVVDFRSTDLLRSGATEGVVPLIYPAHLRDGLVIWPGENGNRGSAIVEGAALDRRLLVPDGHYVVVKRFTAKEERRRVVAAWLAEESLGAATLGIENHLNYLHARGSALARDTAVGLVVYLNSRHVDEYFRQFSGHTQVNASDLRALPYPDPGVLRMIGQAAHIDRLTDPDYFDEFTRPQPNQRPDGAGQGTEPGTVRHGSSA